MADKEKLEEILEKLVEDGYLKKVDDGGDEQKYQLTEEGYEKIREAKEGEEKKSDRDVLEYIR